MEEFGKEIEKELPERKISQDDSVIAAKKAGVSIIMVMILIVIL